jgi:NADPH-dependent curcumin reductase CurA
MSNQNRQITLAAHPEGSPKETDFAMVETPVPRPKTGELLSRTIYLSLDPYMRGRMNRTLGYAKPTKLGEVMFGQTVAQVIESTIDGYKPGDFILNWNGWQDYALSSGTGVRKLDPNGPPISTAVGVLGMPGLTAYVGLLDIGKPKAGETVVVSAASGAVGAIVGQIARLKGCRVVGIAGAREKCDYVTKELGFNACVSRLADTFLTDLKTACPDGVDIYFENAGGKVFQGVLPLLNNYARVPVCGRIANYNLSKPPTGPDLVPRLMGLVLTRRLTMRGFIVWDHSDRESSFLDEVGSWIENGELIYKEDIVDGLEHAIGAFQGLLHGKNFGKLLVRVSDDPTR